MATEVYPVVHINDLRQATEQSAVALERGADGIYLIDHHSGDTNLLFNAFNAVSRLHPEAYVGINALCAPTSYDIFLMMQRALSRGKLRRYPDGAWVDDATPNARETSRLRLMDPELGKIRYLGGVAFKYTPFATNDPMVAAREAVRLRYSVDVVTTSGPGTGVPPSPEKIAAMKESIGKQPLAVASGVSIENLADYDGNIDQLLVATSIETEPGSGIFDRAKLHDLVQMAHGL